MSDDIMRGLIEAKADLGTDGVLVKYGVPRDITPICGLARRSVREGRFGEAEFHGGFRAGSA